MPKLYNFSLVIIISNTTIDGDVGHIVPRILYAFPHLILTIPTWGGWHDDPQSIEDVSEAQRTDSLPTKSQDA